MSSPLATRLKPLVESISNTATSSSHGLEFTLIVPCEAHFWETIHNARNIPPNVLEFYQQLSASSPASGSASVTAIDILPGALEMVAGELSILKETFPTSVSRHDENTRSRPESFRVEGCGFTVSLVAISLAGSDEDVLGSRDLVSENTANSPQVQSTDVREISGGLVGKHLPGSASTVENRQDIQLGTTAFTPGAPDGTVIVSRGLGIESPGRIPVSSNRLEQADETTAPPSFDSHCHVQADKELYENRHDLEVLQQQVSRLNIHNETRCQELVSQRSCQENELYAMCQKLDCSQSKIENQAQVIRGLEERIEYLDQHGIAQDEEIVAKTRELAALQKRYANSIGVAESHAAKTLALEEEVSDLHQTIDTLKQQTRHAGQKALDLEYTEQLKRCGKRITLLKLEALKVAELKVKCQELGIGQRDIPKLHAELVEILMRNIILADEGKDKQGDGSHFLEVALEE